MFRWDEVRVSAGPWRVPMVVRRGSKHNAFPTKQSPPGQQKKNESKSNKEIKMAMNLQGFGEVALSIVAYSICSGTLVLLNKMTLFHLPFPSLVTSFQLSMAVCFIFGAKASGILPVDPIKMEFIIPYSYYIVGFALGVYCNMKSLSLANVETVIVAKALSPCLVSLLDAMFLGRELPSPRSCGAIALIALGAYGYASYDEKFQTQGASAYVWPFCCKYNNRVFWRMKEALEMLLK